MADYSAKDLEPSVLLNSAIANVICSMIMSTRFHHKDEKFNRFMFLFDEGFRLFMDTGFANFIPMFKYLPGVQNTCQKLKDNREEMVTFVREIIDEHRREFDAER